MKIKRKMWFETFNNISLNYCFVGNNFIFICVCMFVGMMMEVLW